MKPNASIGSRDLSVKVQFPTFQSKRLSDRVFRNTMQSVTKRPGIYNQCKSIWQSKTITTGQDHFNESFWDPNSNPSELNKVFLSISAM